MFDLNELCMGCMNEGTNEDVCSVCGYDKKSKNPDDCLPVKYILSSKYIIGACLSKNSESITYMGFDCERNKAVSIKEYFPLNVAVRNPDKTVSVVNGKDFAYNEGLMEFLELNGKLKTVEAPALVPIFAVFEENGTAYSVSSVVNGITLTDFLERNGGKLRWEQARPLFLPLIDTVVALNKENIVHGGISPESIIVCRDGKVRLTNISIIETRFASELFETGIYPGCAAIEQYSSKKGNAGSVTDVYGLSAVLFRTLIGTLPPAANERLSNDSMSIPAHFADELPRQVLVALANGLHIKPEQRTETVERFRDELIYGETKENVQKTELKRKKTEQKEEQKITDKINSMNGKKEKSSTKYALISAGCTVGAFVVIFLILMFTVLRGYFFPKDTKEKKKDDTSMPSVASIGDVDEGADVVSQKLYTVPDMLGQHYSKLGEDEQYENFQIVIKGKEFSDAIARGAICSQSVEPGKEVTKDTEIQVVISLGPKEIKIANVEGLSETEAKLELLKQGFLYDNIEVIEKYDSNKKSGTVLEQSPKYGESVNTDVAVKIFVNSYKEENDD